jgi:proteasome beta subunit
LWRADLDRPGAIRVTVEALYDAADDDAATGGPDVTRGIYPVVMLATADGTERVSDDELGTLVREILAEREARPGA